jgi:hypothetical protein
MMKMSGPSPEANAVWSFEPLTYSGVGVNESSTLVSFCSFQDATMSSNHFACVATVPPGA